ncbi:MAG: type VI secretion system contractile sheath domain-containing protein [Opitutaceae bacterium]
MDFNATFGKPSSPRLRYANEHEGPQFLIIGNFTGITERSALNSLQLTTENFSEQFEGLCPSLELNGETFRFQSIEDFHPDNLLRQSSSLKGLLEQYRSIQQEGKKSIYFRALVNEPSPSSAPSTDDTITADDSDIFADLLGGERPANHTPAASTQPPKNPAVDKLVQSALQGSDQISSDDSNQVECVLQQLTGRLSTSLSNILHHPEFQALEARWLQLDRLMASLEDDSGANIQLLPLSADQWRSWKEKPALATETIQRELELLGGAHALFLCHRFDTSVDELSLLQQLSILSAAANTPLVTSAHSALIGHAPLPELFGSQEAKLPEDSAWSQLKQSVKLDHLYLTIQGVLTRLPYNPKDDPIDSFTYAEDATTLHPNEFLRGDAALIIARLWLENSLESGSAGMPQAPRTLDDLPIYIVENQLLPVAECWMSDEAANILRSQGLVPLCSPKNSGQLSIYL